MNNLYPYFLSKPLLNELGGYLIGEFCRPVSNKIRELGHSIAIKVLLEETTPQLNFLDFHEMGSYEEWKDRGLTLTPVGLFFGEKTSYSIIYQAGPTLQIISTIGYGALIGSYSVVLPSFIDLLDYNFFVKSEDSIFEKIKEVFPFSSKIPITAASFIIPSAIICNSLFKVYNETLNLATGLDFPISRGAYCCNESCWHCSPYQNP